MRTQIGKVFRRSVAQMMLRDFSEFTIVPNPWKDCQLYRLQIAETLSFFLYFVMDRGHDRFNIELAWSETGDFPFELIRLDSDETKIEGRTRISRLWNPDAFEDSWWDLRLQPSVAEVTRSLKSKTATQKDGDLNAISHINTHLRDVEEKLRRYAIPFFQRIASIKNLRFVALKP